ncbi:MAG: dipeptidase PepE [Bacteroidetes bacterium]|nr:dipeptidase PepE [Bacteroidota bacterium]
MKLLLISNSTNPGEAYLGWPRPFIADFLKKYEIGKVLFIPYAGVGLSTQSLKKSYDVYEERVAGVFAEFGCEVESVHHHHDAAAAVSNAACVVVGGGNTFHLVAEMHKHKLMDPIRKRVLDGMPFMGWSAGANVACPTLRTTNDMPIIQPESFNCLNLVPFQINPHYLDAHPAGHGGETRQQRIEEFLVINRNVKVVGLREASLLEVQGLEMKLLGHKPMRLFQFGLEPEEFEVGSDLSFLLHA